MSRQTQTIVMMILTLSAFCFSTAAENTKEDSSDIHSRSIKMKEIFERMPPVQIFGRVVDVEGNPVPGAEVILSWQQATKLIGKLDLHPHYSTILSDKDGSWTFSVEKPHRAYVSDVRKEGYYSYKDIKADSARNVIEQRTTQDNPVLTVLRKKGEETFLIRREGPRPIRADSPHSQTNSLDLMQERPDKLKDGGYTDIRVAVSWQPASNKWTVTYSAPNASDGLIAGTNLLYEAPQKGYQQEIVLSDPPWPRYVYLRSRTPSIFSRLNLEYFPWKGADTNQVFSINYKAWVNPFGDRNFEYDERVKKNWRVEDELTEEAKTAIKAGKRFPKPDIPQRIKAMAERVAREKAEKARRLKE